MARKRKMISCRDCGKSILYDPRGTTGACRACCIKYKAKPTFKPGYIPGFLKVRKFASAKEEFKDYKFASIEEEFWSKVDKSGNCWIWLGSKITRGYGQFHGKPAHRFSWELHNGPIPEGMLACHDCPDGDNPSCVNPDHLFLGTSAQNSADMVSKGRSHFGERNASAKLKKGDVVKIRELWQTGNVSIKELSAQFSISRSQMQDIVAGKKWKRLD